MKKIILLLFFVCNCFVLANSETITEQKQKEIMLPCEYLYQQALQTNNAEDYIQCFECLYKQKEFNMLNKNIKDTTYMWLIAKNIERFEVTKEQKYLKDGYKWSKIAVKEKTNDIFSLKSAIMLASLNINPKLIIKSYDTLCEVNLEECKSFKPNYDELLENTKKYKVQKKQEIKEKWVNGLKNVGSVLLVGIAGFGAGYSSAYSNSYSNTVKTPTMYNATSRQIGNTTYTTIYGY